MSKGLGDFRREFTQMLPMLIMFAQANGYELAIGDAKRPADCSYGHPKSLHKLGLAVDFNLYKDKKYLTKTSDHQILGEYWESIGGCWGGRFNDGNHYSLEYRGMR